MFTLQLINNIHTKLGKQTSLKEYLIALREIGVDNYSSFVTDGHSEYFGKDGHSVISPPEHEEYRVAGTSDREQFLHHLSLHEEGKTNYFEMSKGLAESGIEKWTFDTEAMTIAYYDKDGNEMSFENL